MELFTSLIALFFFSFLYGLGWAKEDYVLEVIGAVGFVLLGVLFWSTGIQLATIESGTLEMITLGASNAFGFIFAIFSIALLIYSGSAITRERKSEI